jgi:hypothetical protein
MGDWRAGALVRAVLLIPSGKAGGRLVRSLHRNRLNGGQSGIHESNGTGAERSIYTLNPLITVLLTLVCKFDYPSAIALKIDRVPLVGPHRFTLDAVIPRHRNPDENAGTYPYSSSPGANFSPASHGLGSVPSHDRSCRRPGAVSRKPAFATLPGY